MTRRGEVQNYEDGSRAKHSSSHRQMRGICGRLFPVSPRPFPAAPTEFARTRRSPKSFPSPLKSLENVSPSLFSGDEENNLTFCLLSKLSHGRIPTTLGCPHRNKRGVHPRLRKICSRIYDDVKGGNRLRKQNDDMNGDKFKISIWAAEKTRERWYINKINHKTMRGLRFS